MKGIFFCFFVFLWCACGPDNKSVKTPPPSPSSASDTHNGTSRQGVIIGDGVRVRADSSLSSPELFQTSTGEKVVILGQSRRLSPPDKTSDICEAFPMINVQTTSGKTGWIFGKYVYEFFEKRTRLPHPAVVEVEGVRYILQVCKNFGVGAWDQEGLTDCPNYYPVILREGRSGQIFPVEIKSSADIRYEFKYWSLYDDTGSADSLAQITSLQNANKFTARIHSTHMENCSEHEVQIVLENGVFKAISGEMKMVEPCKL